MNRIEDLNRQKKAITAILDAKVRQKEAFIVSGPIGSGVSWTLRECSNRWRTGGGTALIATGDPTATSRNLFPWLTMTMPGTKKIARFEAIREGLSQGSKAIPMVGPAASYVVQEVLNHRKRRLGREATLLSPQEQEVVYVIQNCTQSHRLMLIVDHIESWDEASWSLLALIVSGNLDDLYPAFADALIVIGSMVEVPERVLKILKPILTEQLSLRLLDQDEVNVPLKAFGFPSLDENQASQLFKITNGRLDLLSDISGHLKLFGFPTFYDGWKGLFSELVKRRLDELQKHVDDLGNLLTAAAVVGETFGIDDLICLTGVPLDSVNRALTLAASEQLVILTQGSNRFASPELYRYFHEAGSDQHGSYYRKFADCLRLMRPGDYEHRRQYLMLADDTESARICSVLAILAAKREGRKLPDDLLADVQSDPDLRRYLDSMIRAFDSFEDQRLTPGLAAIETIEGFLPDVLIAERDYLEALLLLASPSVENYVKARYLLERWITLESSEGEVWSRVAQNLILAQAQTGKIDDALKLEKDLTGYYWKRRNSDPWSLYGLNILRRRSECLHSLPTANERLENALTFFGSTDSGDMLPRHPIQFYKTLTNLIGNLLALGNSEEAALKASELEDLLKKYIQIPWPSPDIAANNCILAYFLSGKIEAGAGAELLAKVSDKSYETGDRILLRNNLAYLLIHANKLKEAGSVLNAAYDAIVACDEPDSYHRYFVSNNLAILYMMAGQEKKASEYFDICDQDPKDFYPAIQGTIRMRQKLLSKIFTDIQGLDVNQADSLLIRRHGMQIGPQWRFYGTGFLATDIQFWSID